MPDAPPGFAAATDVRCVLDDITWTSSTALRTSVAVPPFAHTVPLYRSGPMATLQLIGGGAARARLELADERLTVEGVVRPEDFQLFAARAMVFAGVFVPYPDTPLRWVGGEGATVEVESPPELKPRAPLRVDASCRQLAARPGKYDATKEAGLADKPSDRHLAHGVDIQLSPAPGAAPTAALRVESPTYVQVHAREGRKRKISLEHDAGISFGWVDAKHLRPIPSGDLLGESFGAGGLGLRGVGQSATPQRWRCDADVPLVADVGGTLRTVATVRPGTLLEPPVGTDPDFERVDWVPVALPDVSWLAPADDARWLVAGALLARCRAAN